MINTKHFIQLAGNSEVWDDETRNCKTSLPELQEDQSARGFRPIKLVLSIYGWTVRYASGLQDNAILYKSGDKNPQKALTWAIGWVNVATTQRELYVSIYDIEQAEKQGFDCSCLRAYQNTHLESNSNEKSD